MNNQNTTNNNDDIASLYFSLFLDAAKGIKKDIILKSALLLDDIARRDGIDCRHQISGVVSFDVFEFIVRPRLCQMANTLIDKRVASTFYISDIGKYHTGGVRILDSDDIIVFAVDVVISQASPSEWNVKYLINTDAKYGSTVNKIILHSGCTGKEPALYGMVYTEGIHDDNWNTSELAQHIDLSKYQVDD